MATQSVIQYVGTSSVRSDIVRQLCDQPQRTADLLSVLDASESAVYDALSNLDTRGIVINTDDGWRLTGTGHLVAGTLSDQRATEQLIERDPKYWENHDAALLPTQFRRRLPELGDYDVVRGTETDINRPVREVANRVKNVESCEIVSPVYHAEYDNAMPDTADSRLVLGSDVIDEVIRPRLEAGNVPTYEKTAVRVTPITFAMGVSTEWTILTLPEYSGEWPSAKIVSEDPSAISWGRDLFEFLWSDAIPLDKYLDTY